jgi:putative FmdB family regulatory protein
VPIYEFTCRDCDHQFEELVKVNGSATAVACPHCGSDDTQRLLSVFAVGAGSQGQQSWPAASNGNGGGCCGGACGCH